jgi:sporulation protein YlmC with PRC-barrel domain
MTDVSIHLMRDVVDHEVVDVHQLPCGSVDDIELELDPRRGLRPVALLIGPGAWQQRLPHWMAGFTRWMVGSGEVRVPWSEIAYIGERVALRRTAIELGLGAADRKWGKRIERVPGA